MGLSACHHHDDDNLGQDVFSQLNDSSNTQNQNTTNTSNQAMSTSNPIVDNTTNNVSNVNDNQTNNNGNNDIFSQLNSNTNTNNNLANNTQANQSNNVSVSNSNQIANTTTQANNTTIQSENVKKVAFSKVNNIGSNLALQFYNQGLLQYSITTWMEGFRNKFYPDNIGNAILFGINLYYQKPNKMIEVTNGILDPQMQANFAKQAGVKELLASSHQVDISPDKGVQIMQNLSPQYVMPAVHVFCPKAKTENECPLYLGLSDNEKAFMFYNDWNAGSFSKMPKISAALRNYAQNKNQANKDMVKNLITYTYRLNGQVIENRKEEAIQQAMWTSKETYYAFITNEPHLVKGVDIASLNQTLPALKDMPALDPNKPLDDQIPDPIGVAREQAVETNTPLNLELYKVGGDVVNGYTPEAPINTAPEKPIKTRSKVLGFM